MTTTNTAAASGAADLRTALIEARRAINSMKVEAETAGAGGDEKMLQEACETISNEGLAATMTIDAALAAAPAQPVAPAGWREVAQRCLTSMEAAVRWRETGVGRPPEQTCMDSIAELQRMLATTAQPAAHALAGEYPPLKKANLGPVHAPNGKVERTPHAYRKELEGQFNNGAKAMEAVWRAYVDADRAARGAAQAAPSEPWRELWHGSPSDKGWSIMQGRELIAYLGPDVASETVTDIVMAHNAAQAAPSLVEFFASACNALTANNPRWQEHAGTTTECAVASIERLSAQAAPVVAVQYLGSADLADLQRLEDLFDDGEGHDLPKMRMVRLAELGAIRHHGGGYYSITAFGRLALGGSFSRLPLETVDECNNRLSNEHKAKLDAARAQEQQP